MRHLCSVLLISVFISTAAYADKVKVGVVGAANEKVLAVDAADNKERSLRTGDAIFFEETIRTDGVGNAQLMFLDKSSLTVGANAEIKIDKFVYDPNTDKGEMGITSTKGAFRFIGGALSKEKPVKIKTPVGTIGIRGSIAMYAVDGSTGATTSTFVSGSEMTMTNMNGVTQVTNSFGTASTIQTPTSPPTPPARIDSATISNTFVAPLTPPPGTSGGAAVIPQADQVNSGVGANLENAPPLAPPATQSPDGSTQQGTGGNSANPPQGGEPQGQDGNNTPPPAGSPNNPPADNPPPAGDAPAGQTPPPPGAPMPQKGSELNMPPPPTGMALDGTNPVVFNVAFNPTQPIGSPTGSPAGGIVPSGTTQIISQSTTENTVVNNTNTSGGTIVLVPRDPNAPPPPPSGSLPPPPPPPDGSLPPPPDGSTTTGSLPPPPTGTCTDASCQSPTPTPPPPPPSGGGGGTTSINPTTFGNYTTTSSSGLEEAGTIEGEIGSSVLKTNIIQNYPSNAPAVREDLQMGASSGINNLNFTSNGQSYTGYQYRTADNAFMYYQIEDSTGDQYKAALGTFLDAASMPSTGYSVYSFLPELYQYLGSSTNSTGFFDYNIASTSLLPAGISAGNMTTTPGLVVSWDRKMYLTGNYISQFVSSSSYGNGFKVAFGKVSSAASTPALSAGRVFEYKSTNDGTTVELGKVSNGYVRAEAAYGNAANGAEGFIVRGILPDSSFSGGDAFAPGVNGTKIMQPVVTNTDTTVTTKVGSAISGATSGTWNGYTAGFKVHDVSGTKTIDTYASNTSNNVQITRTNSGSSSSINADISAQKVGSAGSIIASFGNTAENVFISDKMYAMELASQTTDSVAAGVKNGAMASSYIAGGNKCNGCNYVDWGVWASEVKPTVGATTNDVTMMPYIIGEVTQNISTTGTANFGGKAIGNIADHTNGKITPHEGNFSANVNFGTQQVTNFQITSFSNYNLNYSGAATISPTGPATFTLNPTGAGIATSTVNGAFFGPNAENMGGNFTFSDTGANKSGAGVFLGKTPP